MVYHKCKKCEEQITEDNFCKSKPKWCRVCYLEYHREYREKNAEKLRKAQYDRWIQNKETKLAQQKAWRERNHDERIEKEREYARKNREENSERMRKYREGNRDKVSSAQKRYREKNREKINAHATLNYHVHAGNILIPEVCNLCAKSDPRLEAHHYDYSKPLDVEWLCSSCHKKVHKMLELKLQKVKEKKDG